MKKIKIKRLSLNHQPSVYYSKSIAKSNNRKIKKRGISMLIIHLFYKDLEAQRWIKFHKYLLRLFKLK